MTKILKLYTPVYTAYIIVVVFVSGNKLQLVQRWQFEFIKGQSGRCAKVLQIAEWLVVFYICDKIFSAKGSDAFRDHIFPGMGSRAVGFLSR